MTFSRQIVLILFSALVFSFALSATAVSAAGTDDILGLWNNAEKDAKIEIFKCGELYCGRILSLKEPNYPEGSKDGVPGTPRIDFRNPDSAHQKDPIAGLIIVKGFSSEGDGRYSGGTVYDPKNGKTYKGKMTLVSPGRLDLRGYIGIPIIGRTTSWTR
ncbi:MAG: DUF2147 domain-containing protein [Nitrospiraceae bacterium]|nr:DUF2147 domain-containing protein [Nitrospiraceae bacterium]